MAEKTTLGPGATPGRRYSFEAKTEAAALGVITDPTIESLTTVRMKQSITVERTFSSLTPERVIAAT